MAGRKGWKRVRMHCAILYILFSSGKVLLVIDVRDDVALLISEKDIYRDQMIDTTIWRSF